MESVAVLSDIHGVLPALDAVLAEPAVQAADRIVLTGDIAAGPQPGEVLDRLTVLGERVKAKLAALKGDVPQIADVRGPGAMIAVEFCKPGGTEPDAEFTKRVQARALEHGLLLLVCGVYSNVVRFLFPLTIQTEILDEALTILEHVLKESVAVTA